MIYKLERTLLDKRGTMGLLTGPNIPTLSTLEEPWNGNKRRVSCIPAGKYVCKPHAWGDDKARFHFQEVWEVIGVPDRKAILIHAGNTLNDTEGCILVGLHGGQFKVFESRAAIKLLRDAIGPRWFDLEITEKFPPRENR